MALFKTTNNQLVNSDYVVRAEAFSVKTDEFAVVFDLSTGKSVIIEGLSRAAAKQNIESLKMAAYK